MKTLEIKSVQGRRYWSALVAVCVGVLAQAVPTEFWISPSGSDSTGNGSQGSPWQTIAKARDHIRTNSLNVGMTDDIIVNVGAGDYLLTAPVTFSDADSGSNGRYVIYRNADALASARFHSGAQLTGWTADTGSIWKINVGTGLAIRTFYENEKRAWPARSPNLAPLARYPAFRGAYKISAAGGNTGSNDWIQYASGDFSPGTWTLTGEAAVRWWTSGGSHDWGLVRQPLLSVDVANRKLNFSTTWSTPGTNERYYVEGVYELLDQPGEFFYDSVGGWLYYWPQDGSPDSQDIRLAQSRRLFEFVGSAIGTHVHHIKIEGLRFTDTVPAGGGSDYTWANPSAALMLRHSNNIVIRNCLLERLGTWGVLMIEDNNDNTVYGCLIRNIGAGGIWIQNGLQRATYPTNKSVGHIISNCKIHDYCQVETSSHAAGVYLECVEDTEVSYCEIFNAPRYATSLRGHYSTEWAVNDSGRHFARNNIFRNIKATDGMSDSGDAGVMHAAHVNGTAASGHSGNVNYWSQDLASGAYADSSLKDSQKPNSLFLDHPNSSLDQDFSNVKLGWSQAANFRTNNNPTQTTNNVSWTGTFSEAGMDYLNIGLRYDFPAEYDSRDTVIADDHTIDYSESGANWIDTSVAGLYAGDGRYNGSNNVAQYAEWKPQLSATGNYDVYVWKMATDPGASTAAKYTVYYTGGSQAYTVDLTTPSNQWQLLGRHWFSAGRSGYVRLTANGGSGKAIRADAMRFVFAGGIADDDVTRWTLDNVATDSATAGTADLVTLSGGASYTTGAAVGSHALLLSGVGQYASAADSTDLDIGTGDFAISTWFYRSPNAATNLRILSKGAGTDTTVGYAIYASDSLVVVALGDGSSRTYAAKAYSGTNQWHHLAVNIDRDGFMTVYVDGEPGVPVDISASASLDLGTSYAFNLGRNVNSGSQYWPGRLDAVRIFKRLLSRLEITQLAAEN